MSLDPLLLHLRLNHFPLVLGILGAVALVVALIARRDWLLRYAQVTLILAGITAPMAFFSGNAAEEKVEDSWYIDEDELKEHEEFGEKAAIALGLTGVIAALSLWKKHRALKALLLVAALVAAVLVTVTGYEGGKIEHENPMLIKSQRPPTV